MARLEPNPGHHRARDPHGTPVKSFSSNRSLVLLEGFPGEETAKLLYKMV